LSCVGTYAAFDAHYSHEMAARSAPAPQAPIEGRGAIAAAGIGMGASWLMGQSSSRKAKKQQGVMPNAAAVNPFRTVT
jgi:hypothetical protein